MTTKQWKFLFHIFVIVGIFIGGFFTGRSTVKVKEVTTIQYIKGDTIRDTVYYPKPYKEIIPIDTLAIIQQCIKDGIYQELWPEKVITEYIEVTKEDTTKIMTDWATKRYYNEVLFQNDSIGSCSVNTEVQYNRMRLLGYNFVPVTKQVNETKYLVKTFSPFVGAGYLTNPWDENRDPIININGGVFIKEKYGVQIQLMHALKSKNDYIGGSFLIKF